MAEKKLFQNPEEPIEVHQNLEESQIEFQLLSLRQMSSNNLK